MIICHKYFLCFGWFKEVNIISSNYFKPKFIISLFLSMKNCTSGLNFGYDNKGNTIFIGKNAANHSPIPRKKIKKYFDCGHDYR